MPSPIKTIPGQQSIRQFMSLRPNSHDADGAADDTSNQTLRQRPDMTSQTLITTNTSPNAVNQVIRRRRIHDSDDDDIPITIVVPNPVERILVHDTADESDSNFGVLLLQTTPQHQPQSDPATPQVPASKPTPRRSHRKRPLQQPTHDNPVSTKFRY
jgi:hypothetical protein